MKKEVFLYFNVDGNYFDPKSYMVSEYETNGPKWIRVPGVHTIDFVPFTRDVLVKEGIKHLRGVEAVGRQDLEKLNREVGKQINKLLALGTDD